MSETSFTARSGQNARLFGVKDTTTGKMYFTAQAGNNSYTMPFPFDCKFEGIEIFSQDANIGDHIPMFEVRYSIDGGVNWLRFRKFAKNWSIFPSTLCRIILFPTEPKAGTLLAFDYYNEGATAIKFSLNLFVMTDEEAVDVMQAEEGEDW